VNYQCGQGMFTVQSNGGTAVPGRMLVCRMLRWCGAAPRTHLRKDFVLYKSKKCLTGLSSISAHFIILCAEKNCFEPEIQIFGADRASLCYLHRWCRATTATSPPTTGRTYPLAPSLSNEKGRCSFQFATETQYSAGF